MTSAARGSEPVALTPDRPRKPDTRRRVLDFVVTFGGVFLGLALAHGPGPFVSRAITALCNLWVDSRSLASGASLHFSATETELAAHPWHTVLHVVRALPAGPVEIPIDLRTLVFLPTAAFIALAIAAPLASVREHLRLLVLGLLLLEPLLLVLVLVPLVTFLGGAGPVQVFTLSRGTLVLLEVVYRALVAPPGMAYATPLLVFWGLRTSKGTHT